MATRKLVKSQYTYRTPDEVPTLSIDISDQLVKLKVEVEYEKQATVLVDGEIETSTEIVRETIHNLEIPLSELKKKANFKSNTMFGVITLRESQNKTMVIDRNIMNISSETYTQRAKNPFSGAIYNSTLVTFLVKDPSGDFSDFDIMVFAPSSESLIVNSNVELEQVGMLDVDPVSMLDPITATKDDSYSNAEYIKYNVSAPSYVDEVSVEPIIGITDRARIFMDNGSGHFRVLKSSVENTYDIRIGYISYPRLVNVTGTI